MKEQYPEDFENGYTFACSWLKVLKKMEKNKILKSIVGMEVLPLSDNPDGIEKFIIDIAIPVSRKQCLRDLNERGIADNECNIQAFIMSFHSSMFHLLSQPREVNVP